MADEILWNHRFADILHLDSNGHRYVDYSHFHTTLPAQAPCPRLEGNP
ncbi:hypothetical protein [Synechococcus sp. 65AY6A5]